MKKLRVNTGNPYDILIERGLLKNCGRFIAEVSNAGKIVVISDTRVAPLYLEAAQKSLEAEGRLVFPFIFEAGEASKTAKTVIEMVEFCAEKGLTRKDLIVALGGGVTGDMAGFAAAVYLRGIDFVQIPTSLLAQVDSSVGGKTAVDLPQGKNLCGAFHQPRLVLIDPDTLDTLPQRYFNDGMGEVIKYGCIKSEALFERLENENPHDFIEDMIFECVDIKRVIVENDEKEQGERMLLNFGHTAGHAIEKLCNFEGVSHGEAVGIGMVMITRAGENNGITAAGSADRIYNLLKKYDMPTEDSHTLTEIIAAMGADKKRTGRGINFTMIKKIGEGFIYPVRNEDIEALFIK